jgi:NADH-quinone oxidoreductase subunit M
MILNGSFHALALENPAWFVGFASLGIILGAGYMLILFERVFLGKIRQDENHDLLDMNLREGLVLLLPVVFSIWLGVQPNIVLSKVEPAIQTLWNDVASSRQMTANMERVQP